MKKSNIKRVVSIFLGVMMIGSLVSCGTKKEDDPEATLTTALANKEKIEIINIDGEDRKCVTEDIFGSAGGILDIKAKWYMQKVGVDEKQGAYVEMYWGYYKKDKYGKSNWIIDETTVPYEEESLNTLYTLYEYMFDKESLDGSINIKDTGITEFIRNTTLLPLTKDEVKLIQDKFDVFKRTNEGADRINSSKKIR